MLEFLNEVDAFVWGPPLLCLLVGTGIWLTIRLNMIQVLRLPLALKLIFKAKTRAMAMLIVLKRCVRHLLQQ